MNPLRFAFFFGLTLPLLVGCSGGSGGSAAPGTAAAPNRPFQFRNVAAEVGLEWSHDNGGETPLNILRTGGIGGGFVDVDSDGWLDVVIASPKGAAVFLNRKERFERVADAAGLPQTGIWQGLSAGDVDNDGDADVFLNGYRDQRLFLNEKGRFVDRTAAFGLTDRSHWGTGSTFVDFDNDGFLDLFVCRYLKFDSKSLQFCKEGSVQISCQPAVYPAEKGVLYRSVNGKRFKPFQPETFSKSAGKNWSVLPFDYDADGWTDLYVSNDTEAADLWHNLEGKGFENVAFQSGVALSPMGRAYGGMGLDSEDVDGDERLDFLITTFTDEPKSLFRNLQDGSGFQDISEDFGLSALRPWVTFGATMGDFDNDGWVDLAAVSGHIIDNYQQIEPTSPYRQPVTFFHNQSGKRFVSVDPADGEGVITPMVGRALARGDYDNDGRLDLLALDLEGPVRLLHNETHAQGAWVGMVLKGRKQNRDGLGCRVTLTAGGRSRVTEARTGGSLLATRDARVHFGLGTDTPTAATVRWPSGIVQITKDIDANAYVVVEEPSGP